MEVIKEHEKTAYKIGLKPWEFWALTFAEFQMILDGYVENKNYENENIKIKEHNENVRNALLCSTIMNAQRTSDKQKVYTIEDFLLTGEKKAKEPKSDEELLKMVKVLNKAFGGSGG